MATVTKWVDGLSATQPIGTQLSVVHNVIDFSETSASAADVIQALKIPANAFVLHVGWEVQTAEGGTCTCTIGDGTTADGFDTGVNMNSAAAGHSVDGTDASVGKFYSTADTIDLTLGHDTDACVFYIWAVIGVAERS